MRPISTLFGDKRLQPVKSHKTERGDLFDAMLSRLNPPGLKEGYRPITHKRLAYLLTGIETKDLYYLVSVCDDADRRGYPWSAIFWKEIAPQKAN